MDAFLDNDMIEDDLEVLELVEVGIPRRVYQRNDHFHALSEHAFFIRFRLTKETNVRVLREIEHNLEFPYDK